MTKQASEVFMESKIDESKMTLPEYCRGQVLVMYDNCKQAILDPNAFVIVDEEYVRKLEEEDNSPPISSADDLPL